MPLWRSKTLLLVAFFHCNPDGGLRRPPSTPGEVLPDKKAKYDTVIIGEST